MAEKVVSETIGSMPLDLREHAQAVMVSYESVPPAELVDEGWDPDLLGLFEGDSYAGADGEGDVLPRRIRLFLENLWDFAEGDLEGYREEVRITYLHEFGHYLGLDEDGLAERGLE